MNFQKSLRIPKLLLGDTLRDLYFWESQYYYQEYRQRQKKTTKERIPKESWKRMIKIGIGVSFCLFSLVSLVSIPSWTGIQCRPNVRESAENHTMISDIVNNTPYVFFKESFEMLAKSWKNPELFPPPPTPPHENYRYQHQDNLLRVWKRLLRNVRIIDGSVFGSLKKNPKVTFNDPWTKRNWALLRITGEERPSPANLIEWW